MPEGGLWGFQKETAQRLKTFAEALGDSNTNLRVNTNHPNKGGYLAIPKGTISAASGLTLGEGTVTLFQRNKSISSPDLIKTTPDLEPTATRIDIPVYNYLEQTFSGDPDNPVLADLVLLIQDRRGDFYVLPSSEGEPASGCTMPREGLVSASAGTGDAAWQNIGNVLRGTSNTVFAHATLGVGESTELLQVTDFEIEDLLPEGNITITGIEVTLILGVANEGAADSVRDESIKLMKGGAEVGDSLHRPAIELWSDPGFEVPIVYGGSTTLWGTTWAKTDFDSGFGVSIKAQDFSFDGSEARVFDVSIRVCWIMTPNVENGTFFTTGQSQTMSDTSTIITGGTVTTAISDSSLASHDNITGKTTTSIAGRWRVELDSTFTITGPNVGGDPWHYDAAVVELYTDDGGETLIATMYAGVHDTGNGEVTYENMSAVVSLAAGSDIYFKGYLIDNTWAGEVGTFKVTLTYLGPEYA